MSMSVQRATEIVVDCCRNESCAGHVFVRLLDASGAPFAVAGMSAEDAILMAAKLCDLSEHLLDRRDAFNRATRQ